MYLKYYPRGGKTIHWTIEVILYESSKPNLADIHNEIMTMLQISCSGTSFRLRAWQLAQRTGWCCLWAEQRTKHTYDVEPWRRTLFRDNNKKKKKKRQRHTCMLPLEQRTGIACISGNSGYSETQIHSIIRFRLQSSLSVFIHCSNSNKTEHLSP